MKRHQWFGLRVFMSFSLVFMAMSHVSWAMQPALQFGRVAGPGVRPQFPGTIVPRADFFRDVMAHTPCPTEQVLKNFLAQQDQTEYLYGYENFQTSCLVTLDGHSLVLQSAPSLLSWIGLRNDVTYQCGAFQELSMDDLAHAADDVELRWGGTFNVVEGIDTQWDSWFRHFVDVGALQADPNNHDAVFQVASNFNGLETVNPQQNIEEQFLESYIHDLTQGPAASISAAPGLIQRHYFMYYDPAAPKRSWPQTIPHHVNFLSELEHVLPVSRAGYVMLPDVPGQLGPNDYGQIKVGFHADVQVTHGFVVDRQRHMFIAQQNPNQRINQVFTAAIDFGGANHQHRNNPNAQALAQHVLNAAYQGTIFAAHSAGKRKVFLTLVGGGVFDNDLNWIFNAINRLRATIIASGLEVILIWRNTLHGHPQVRARFAALVNQTGGVYTQFRQDGQYRLGAQQ